MCSADYCMRSFKALTGLLAGFWYKPLSCWGGAVNLLQVRLYPYHHFQHQHWLRH